MLFMCPRDFIELRSAAAALPASSDVATVKNLDWEQRRNAWEACVN